MASAPLPNGAPPDPTPRTYGAATPPVASTDASSAGRRLDCDLRPASATGGGRLDGGRRCGLDGRRGRLGDGRGRLGDGRRCGFGGRRGRFGDGRGCLGDGRGRLARARGLDGRRGRFGDGRGRLATGAGGLGLGGGAALGRRGAGRLGRRPRRLGATSSTGTAVVAVASAAGASAPPVLPKTSACCCRRRAAGPALALGHRRAGRLGGGAGGRAAALQVRARILGHAVLADLEVHVRPGAAAGAADLADLLARLHVLVHGHAALGQVGVARGRLARVADADHLSRSRSPCRTR